MKKTFITAFTFGIAFSSFALLASADSRDDVTIPSSPSISSVAHVEERNNEESNERKYRSGPKLTLLARIQANGDKLIKERLNSLASNTTAITSSKSLTPDQKNALSLIINTNITGLTALRVSIASSTDATSTKALVNSIFTNFRIYGIVIPQIRLEKRIYDLQNHSGTLSDTFLKVQVKIDEAKTKGKDVTVWQKSLDDAKILVVNDMNTLANLLIKVGALKPVDYGTTSKAIIESSNLTIQSVLKDFNSIKKNLHRPAMMSSRKITGNGYASTSPLFGTSWIWTSMMQSGTTTQAPSGGKFVLSFGEDNRVHSTTDCNGVGGSYTLGANNGISFGPFMSTMMYCEGSHESSYSLMLTSTTAYKIDGSNLVLTTASGTMMFVKK